MTRSVAMGAPARKWADYAGACHRAALLRGPVGLICPRAYALFLQQRIALLDQPFKRFVLLRDPIRVSIFVLGAGDGSRLLDQLPDVVTSDGDARFEFLERKWIAVAHDVFPKVTLRIRSGV